MVSSAGNHFSSHSNNLHVSKSFPQHYKTLNNKSEQEKLKSIQGKNRPDHKYADESSIGHQHIPARLSTRALVVSLCTFFTRISGSFDPQIFGMYVLHLKGLDVEDLNGYGLNAKGVPFLPNLVCIKKNI